jgi:hypothetical protein
LNCDTFLVTFPSTVIIVPFLFVTILGSTLYFVVNLLSWLSLFIITVCLLDLRGSFCRRKISSGTTCDCLSLGLLELWGSPFFLLQRVVWS